MLRAIVGLNLRKSKPSRLTTRRRKSFQKADSHLLSDDEESAFKT
jgi:hypothetical protein